MPWVEHETYLGDGLYASLTDANMIKLRAPRNGVDHWVAMEETVFISLIRFAHEIGWGKFIQRGTKPYIPDDDE